MKTIKDIARAAGVSTSTVSKALNGYADVGAETADLIRRTAERLHYMPNAAARMLKTNISHNIGVVFEDETMSGLTHEYFSHILNSAKNELEDHGYDITFISQKVGGNSFLEHCRYRKVDGVLIASVDFTNPMVRKLVMSEFPTVTIDYAFDSHSCVMSDNVEGAAELVSYLYRMGHRRIAFIHGEKTSVTIKRLSGFYKKVKELARKSALSYKAQENAIVVLEDFNFEAPKTKDFVAIAKNLKVDGKKLLLLMPSANKNVYLSARNLQRAEVLEADKLNTYKVLNADVLLITEQSLQAIDNVLGK